MQHPVIFLIPIAIQFGTYLTIYSARLHKGNYVQHVKYTDGVLVNQIDKLAARKNLFGVRQILAMLFITACLYYLAEIKQAEDFMQFFYGFFGAVYGIVIGRQLHNVFFYRFMNRHPEALKGEIAYSAEATRYTAALDMVRTAPLILLVVCWRPEVFTWGLLAGYVILVLRPLFANNTASK